MTRYSEGCHEHSRFSLAEMFSFARGFGLHGVVPVLSVPAVGHDIGSAVFSLCCITVYDFSARSESDVAPGRT